MVRNVVLPTIASFLLPGLGQLLQSRFKRGGTYFISYLAFLLVFAVFRLSQTPEAFSVGRLVPVLLSLTAGLDALILGARTVRAPRWTIGLTAPAAVLALLSVYPLQFAMLLSGFRIFAVPSTAMEPTIMLNDWVMADMRAYHEQRPRHGDVVVFIHPDQLIWMAKRVIATGGDTISGDDDKVFLNDALLEENHVPSGEHGHSRYSSFGPVTVPAHHVFVVGDNRRGSYDSRDPDHGTIPASHVFGRVLYILDSDDPDRNGKPVQ